jgi:hypothetical protein
MMCALTLAGALLVQDAVAALPAPDRVLGSDLVLLVTIWV